MRALVLVIALAGCGGTAADTQTLALDGGGNDGALAIDATDAAGLPVADMGPSPAQADMQQAADLAPEATCGIADKPCCNGTADELGGFSRGGTCDATTACYPFSTASLCKPCGGDDETCCAGAKACNVAGDLCRPADNAHGIYAPTCYPCGGPGQAACANNPVQCWTAPYPGPDGKCP